MFSRRQVVLSNTYIKIGDVTMDWTEGVKNIVLCMGRKLNFNSYINQISRLQPNSLYEFYKILPPKAKRLLIQSLVLSNSGYLVNAYGPFLKNCNKYRVQKIQNLSARYDHSFSLRDHVIQQVAQLFTCNMGEMGFLHLCCLIHILFNNRITSYFFSAVMERGELHQCNTRSRRNIVGIEQNI